MTDNTENPFAGLKPAANDVIEKLLGDLYGAGEWTDEHQDWLQQWREARGDEGKGPWRWWIGPVDGEAYEFDFDTREAAVAEGELEYASYGRFLIMEARNWTDTVEEGEDISMFAESRHRAEIVIVGETTGGEE